MMWQIDGAEIVTPEGLDAAPQARHVRAALADENGFQYGYCAPGFTVALTALLRDVPSRRTRPRYGRRSAAISAAAPAITRSYAAPCAQPNCAVSRTNPHN
jgi:aerobic-type carbon monoxide dehydrogenase small subunit (CoxS/CutS family)